MLGAMGTKALVGPVTGYIAGELRAQMARKGWTLDGIAEKTGLPRSTVYRALRGETAIAVEVLLPLCEGMRLDVAVLLRNAAALRA